MIAKPRLEQLRRTLPPNSNGRQCFPDFSPSLGALPSIMLQSSRQILLDHFPEFFRVQNQRLWPHTQHPSFDFIKSSHFEGQFDSAVGQLGNPLAFLPNLFSKPSSPSWRNFYLYRIKFIVHYLEAVAHEMILPGQATRK
jgi:hypothetical protein